jgi:hypothetical protein
VEFVQEIIDATLPQIVVDNTYLSRLHGVLSVVGLLTAFITIPAITTVFAVGVLGTIPAHQLIYGLATVATYWAFLLFVAWKLPTTTTASISTSLKITSTVRTGKLQHFATSSSNRRHSYSSFGLIIIIDC